MTKHNDLIDYYVRVSPPIGKLFNSVDWLSIPASIVYTAVPVAKHKKNNLDQDTFDNMAFWCAKHIGVENYIYLVIQSTFYFRTAEQATLFKLKFGEICH